MTNKIESHQQFLIVVATLLFIGTFFIPEKYNLYDYLKSIRLQSYNEKHKEIFIKCLYCKGTGEREEDTNRTMFLAKVALYLNKHLMVDKCNKCEKLSDSDKYFYCDEAEKQYQIFLQEYGAAGPKVEKTGCSKCLGMGTFSSFDIEQKKYLTQEEYEAREKAKSND
jgi:hypothetical protein